MWHCLALGRVDAGRRMSCACQTPYHWTSIADVKRFQDVLKSALWRDNVLRLKAQAQVL